MEIFENNKNHLPDFISLNEEWISKYFQLEDVDTKLSENPHVVIDDGGYVFSLVDGTKVVGVCALFNDGDGVYELARMAVSPEHQGKGYGSKLIEACLKKLCKILAKKVYVVSNTKLEPAILLYKKYGFVTKFEGVHPVYTRANIVMELNVT